METTIKHPPLVLPGAAKAGWTIDVPAIREAIAFFGLTSPVEVKLTAGTRRVGCARYRDGVHVITLSALRSGAQASETLWHELTHAAQREYLGDEAFRVQYQMEQLREGYDRNRFEVEARDTAAVMTAELSLTKRA